MNKKKEGNVKMVILNQEDIKARIFKNSSKFKRTIEQVTSEIQKQKLKKGRVRPKDPVEAMILNEFKK